MNEPQGTARRLVESLLQYCDIDSPDLEKEDKVLVSVDGKSAFLIRIDGNLIHLTGFLGQASTLDRFNLGLLHENFKSCSGLEGYRYSIDPETDELTMSLTTRAESMTQDRFIDEFERFVAFSVHWTSSLAAGSVEIPVAPSPVDEDDDGHVPDVKFSGHMRV